MTTEKQAIVAARLDELRESRSGRLPVQVLNEYSGIAVENPFREVS